ncbi:MAG: ribbon-helix-helix protein, CopG family [Candidatus Latescibacterota bacterium]
MRTTKLVTISLPPELLIKIEKLARKENRTRSELLRETVRQYLAREEWRELNIYARSAAVKAGIKTEKDIERLVNESRDGQSNG